VPSGETRLIVIDIPNTDIATNEGVACVRYVYEAMCLTYSGVIWLKTKGVRS